jgi:AraC-like DNA-binding protein
MPKQFRVSTLFPQRLEELGLSPAVVLRYAGLPIGLFSREKILLTTEELFALWRAIGDVSADPAIGLKLGSEQRIERYDPIGIAALYTRSFRDALQRLARYKQLTCPEEISLVENDRESAVQFKWLHAKEAEPTVLLDCCFAWIVGIGRRGTGRAITPIRVEFQRTSANREVFQSHFKCAVKFKAGRNALIFKRADIDQPFLTHNAELLAMLAPQLDAELNSQQAEQTARDNVKVIIKRLLAGQRPGMLEVARELNMSPRSLQRRLTEDGVTFQKLLEEARRELAHHYLVHSSLELTQTAYLLGYENSNSFLRAFHNWEGTSPGKWRAMQLSGRHSNGRGD